MRGLISSGAYHALSPLDTLIVSQLGRFVKGFLEIIFKKVACRKVGSYTASANSSTPSVGFPTPEVFPPLDTNSIPHPSPNCNRQNVQNRDFYFPKLCATFRLTNCWRCDSNAHHPFADSTEDTSHRWENPTRTGGVAHRGTLRNRRTPSAFCTLIVSHFKGFVKRFFTFCESLTRSASTTLSMCALSS